MEKLEKRKSEIKAEESELVKAKNALEELKTVLSDRESKLVMEKYLLEKERDEFECKASD